MKFKVGDKVRIRPDLDYVHEGGGLEVVDDMIDLRGQVDTIAVVDLDYTGREKYRLEGHRWLWNDNMLIPESEPVFKAVDKATQRFKVGDKVRLKSGLIIGQKYGGLTYDNMPYKDYTIKSYDAMDNTYLCKTSDGDEYWLSDEMLESKRGFKRGDRVRVVDRSGSMGGIEVGECGVILKAETGGLYAVRFDKYSKNRHDCWGLCEDGYGWNCKDYNLELEDVGYNPFEFIEPIPLVRADAIWLDSNPWMLTTKKKVEDTIMTYYVTDGKRIDKTCNKQIDTKTTHVTILGGRYSGKATCDAENYDQRQGLLEAIANAVCNGNFDKYYNDDIKARKRLEKALCRCSICGVTYDTPEEARACEQAHKDRKQAKLEKYLISKEAKRRIAEAEREGKIEELMKDLLKKKAEK